MPFDLDALESYSLAALSTFAAEHRDETFYGFAIDDGLLCLNSEEEAAVVLAEYQEQWDRVSRELGSLAERTPEQVRDDEFLLRICQVDPADEEACLTVLNESRKERRERGCRWRTEEGIQYLRMNTGDWAYQGFADLNEIDGYDADAAAVHYGLGPVRQKVSAYARAMNWLLGRLRKRRAFEGLRTTPGFFAIRVEHDD